MINAQITTRISFLNGALGLRNMTGDKLTLFTKCTIQNTNMYMINGVSRIQNRFLTKLTAHNTAQFKSPQKQPSIST
jgi:hypothetical protein